MTSSRKTPKPARAARSASERPSGPAPMMAMVGLGCNGMERGAGLLCGEGFGHVGGVGAGLLQVLGDPGALLGGKGAGSGKNAAQGNGDVVNIVHQANGFSGKRHGVPRGLEFWLLL